MQEKAYNSFTQLSLAQLITSLAVHGISNNTVLLTRQYCLRHLCYDFLLVDSHKGYLLIIR